MMADRKIRKKDCVRLSNKIIERCQLAVPTISGIRDIRSNLFVGLLEVLSHRLPPGIISDPATPADEVHNIQTIINHLALDLIDVDLSHISAAGIIGGDPRAIYNLLEIFCGLHKYLSSHEIDKWNLEESLTETEEELSSSSSSSSSPAADSPPPQVEEAALAAGREKAPSAEAVTSYESGRPSKTPSRRSSAGGGVRGSASAGSRPSSSGGTPGGTPGGTSGGTPGAGGGSPARRRSADSPALALTPSGSGTGTSTKVSTSGSAGGVSFPESQYSLEMELPITKSGGRDPLAQRQSQGSQDSTASAAAATSSSQETPADQETPGDEETPAGDEETLGDEETPAAERGQKTPAEDQTTSEGAAETARSSESTAPDSPTTETLQTTETEGTAESEETGEEEGEEEEPSPQEPHHFQFLDEQSPSDEDVNSVDEAEEAEDGNEDISRQLSQELQQLQQQQTSSGPEQTSSGAEKKKKCKKSSTTPSSDTARSRPARSAPCAAAARRHRSSDHSSTSDPGVNGRRPLCRRLLTRNIETIAEIHESGGERAVTRTTREQAGDKLCKETVQREVRRKVHSAPQPTTRNMSFSKQSSRRSICSDGVIRWLESQADVSYLKVEGQETDVFEFLRREFPYVRVSEETKRKLLTQYRHQMKYIMRLVEPATETRNYSIRRKDVLKRQALLTDIIRQQKVHDQRFRRLKSTRLAAIKQRNAPRDARISCLRAQRCVDSYKQQFQSRMALNKSREELLMKAVFEEMLEIQRHRLRSVRSLEKRAIREFYGADGYTAELNRMHQFYEANFRDLAQMLSKEKTDLQVSQKEQQKLADRIKREFRDYMEADVKSLNDKVVTSWQPQYRELDADRIRSDLYEANWKFCVT